MTIKVVADEAIPFISAYFSHIAEVDLLPGHEISRACLEGADVLVCRTVTRVNEALLHNTSVKLVASPTSGLDHVDQEYLESRNIRLCSAPGCNATSVAEYVLSALFVLAQQHQFQLAEKSVGIVGCGHVGSRLKQLLAALGISYRLCDPFLNSDDHDTYEDMDAIAECDIISLHVPLTDASPHPTRGLLDEGFFASLDRDVVIVNTSRGGVVNEAALKHFRTSRPGVLVVNDVWENEPRADEELVRMCDIATPHIAGYSLDGKLAATRAVFEQVCDFFHEGKREGPDTGLLPPREAIRVAGDDDSELDTVALAILASYDVRSDAAAMRRMLEEEVTDRAAYFLDLRNNYPPRREFSSLALELENESNELREKLLRLGFRVTTH